MKPTIELLEFTDRTRPTPQDDAETRSSSPPGLLSMSMVRDDQDDDGDDERLAVVVLHNLCSGGAASRNSFHSLVRPHNNDSRVPFSFLAAARQRV
ncbi:hypothetical protein PC128_g13076 [Phytophthora cactorum]|nr:hypothetical protein PC120_g11431 [Phytophthora cactorum]KAG3186156.1 hypothetical protein PC128_g13076 [Phytophthora cactorum]